MKGKLIGFGMMLLFFIILFNGLSWLVNSFIPVQNKIMVFIWSAIVLGLSLAISLLTSNQLLQYLKSRGTI